MGGTKTILLDLPPSIEEALRRGDSVSVSGLAGSSKAFFLSLLFGKDSRSTLLLTPTQKAGEQLAKDLSFFCSHFVGSSDEVCTFPSVDLLPEEPQDPRVIGRRMKTLHRLSKGEKTYVVASLHSLSRSVPLRDSLSFLEIRTGENHFLEEVMGYLEAVGYRRVSMVQEPGEMALRGGIVDIFEVVHENPFRIEFIGDTCGSIRTFDPLTQRSISTVEDLLILPAEEGRGSGTLLEYLPSELFLVLDEPGEMTREGKDLLKGVISRTPPPRVIELRSLPLSGRGLSFPVKSVQGLGLGVSGTPFAHSASKLDRLRQTARVVLVCRTEGGRTRLSHLLGEYDLPATSWTGRGLSPGSGPFPLVLTVGHLSSGFFSPQASVAFLSEDELLGRGIHHTVPRGGVAGRLLSSFGDLKESDYVVHVHHGIGRYCGLKRLTINGFESDFLLLQYQGEDKLYIPLDRLGMVQKYIGADGQIVRVDKLGGQRWVRTTQRVKRSVEKIARELLDLYATREVVDGFAFSLDTPLSEEFEAAFEYEETPDQFRAIEEVKRDMERPRSMDRLVCGDVGYGKTEVAMRAAFKAAMDNKQVAFLVPTTLLAQQHYWTFSRRSSPFPIKVEMLSRFRTPVEQKRILRELMEGKVDIIIGTHRLLQKDVRFRALGLLIIDEEQRFGVTHKERLKQMRKTVDVLTLTATPIPRTLQLSLVGIRDLSLIDTPPVGRLAVKTILARFGKDLIRETIRRELARGGQVFFVHNRIQGIERMAQFLRGLVPEARVATAHGQMPERQLEGIMLKFMAREYDLLVTTAIVESGLDISSLNTIIINRADRFGLADLYQLRGRVGRAGEQAFAYLLIPDEFSLSPEAKERLMTLQEFCELGSGFRIAARDMEIRGAGNLLGPEQSGHIAAVGLELYLQMMERAVRELKGERIPEEKEVTLRLKVSAFLPEEYIPDSYQRLALYKRLSSCEEIEALPPLAEELVDRYGPPPQPVQRLLHIIEIKIRARAGGVLQIESTPEGVLVLFDQNRIFEEETIRDLMMVYRNRIRFLSEYSVMVSLPQEPWEKLYAELVGFLQMVGREESSVRGVR